ncbi:hypothetical protein O9929_05195 [Vibrio lentus]|nr:hypothetical protein [Vibrio lentus]
MRGFFTDEELADGKGVIHTEDEIKARSLQLNNASTYVTYFRRSLTARIASSTDCQHCRVFWPNSHQSIATSLLYASAQKFMMIERLAVLNRKALYGDLV